MEKSIDLPKKRQIALLLVGAPGSGKTTLALQFPKPYIFDVDGNLQGPTEYLERIGKRPGYFYDSAFLKTSDIPGQGKVAVPPFQRYTHFIKCIKEAASSPDVETIILDSLTGFKDIVKDDILRQRGINPNVKLPTPTEDQRGMTPLVIQEWDTYAFYFRNLVTLMRSTTKNFILTAHYEKIQDEADKLWMECLAVQGQSRHTLSALFTDTWQPFIQKNGFGDNATYTRMIRTVAINDTDHKGNKTSLNLPPIFANDYSIIRPFIELDGGTNPAVPS